MTTIAWDGTYLAADKQAGNHYVVGKIFPIPGGRYLAGAGYYDQIVEVAAWLQAGGEADKKPNFPAEGDSSSLLLVEPSGTAYWLTWPFLRLVEINEPFAAMGSGEDLAVGAMAMGASAKKAVSIATRFDPYTGKGITCVKVKK